MCLWRGHEEPVCPVEICSGVPILTVTDQTVNEGIETETDREILKPSTNPRLAPMWLAVWLAQNQARLGIIVSRFWGLSRFG